MDKIERKEAELLEHIKAAIALYNEITENKVELVYQGEKKRDSIPEKEGRRNAKDTSATPYPRQIHIPIGVKKEPVHMEGKRYIGNVFVCAYDGEVGLFTQVNWTEKSYNNFISIYTGLEVEKTGIWKSTSSVLGQKHRWLKSGETVTFQKYGQLYEQSEATCNMYGAMNFEEMRSIMRKNQMISGYTAAYASSEEIEEVLLFATSYFYSETNKKKGKTFSKTYKR